MKRITTILALSLYCACLTSFMYCNMDKKQVVTVKEHTYETDDTKFHNGEILLPDYAHIDTLIVVNADSLNWAMEYYNPESDGDISDILNAYCSPLINIILQVTDNRGLTSITYTQGIDTFALDYLNKLELDSLKQSIK